MNKKYINIISGLLILLLTVQFCEGVKAQEQIHLFPDKSYAVSGDTIWFHIFIYGLRQDSISQVVHVQLDDINENHILKVSVLCHGAFGEGYIPVPDSLSTGVYLLNPFSLVEKNSKSAVINQKYINVYNRFDENITTIQKPDDSVLKEYTREDGITIQTNRGNYKKRENVLVSFELPEDKLNDFQRIFITAEIRDPISAQYILTDAPTQTMKLQYP